MLRCCPAIFPHPHSHTPALVLCSELATIAIEREPDEDDYRYLATRAGFVMGADAMRGTLASLEELAAFKAWFSG